jgi:hypothetical protein
LATITMGMTIHMADMTTVIPMHTTLREEPATMITIMTTIMRAPLH